MATQVKKPVTIQETADRRTVWALEVDGQFIRWCGTLEQFEKDCIEYCDCSEGEWRRNGPHSLDFIMKIGSRREVTHFRAVKR